MMTDVDTEAAGAAAMTTTDPAAMTPIVTVAVTMAATMVAATIVMITVTVAVVSTATRPVARIAVIVTIVGVTMTVMLTLLVMIHARDTLAAMSLVGMTGTVGKVKLEIDSRPLRDLAQHSIFLSSFPQCVLFFYFFIFFSKSALSPFLLRE